jgi:hypothetical protein
MFGTSSLVSESLDIIAPLKSDVAGLLCCSFTQLTYTETGRRSQSVACRTNRKMQCRVKHFVRLKLTGVRIVLWRRGCQK